MHTLVWDFLESTPLFSQGLFNTNRHHFVLFPLPWPPFGVLQYRHPVDFTLYTVSGWLTFSLLCQITRRFRLIYYYSHSFTTILPTNDLLLTFWSFQKLDALFSWYTYAMGSLPRGFSICSIVTRSYNSPSTVVMSWVWPTSHLISLILH